MSGSITDGLPYLYAEDLRGKRFTLTIDRIVPDVEFISADGRKATGFDVHFKETPKRLGVTSVTVRRQLAAACGTTELAGMVGKRVVLYPTASKRSTTGLAIRVAPAEVG